MLHLKKVSVKYSVIVNGFHFLFSQLLNVLETNIFLQPNFSVFKCYFVMKNVLSKHKTIAALCQVNANRFFSSRAAGKERCGKWSHLLQSWLK